MLLVGDVLQKVLENNLTEISIHTIHFKEHPFLHLMITQMTVSGYNLEINNKNFNFGGNQNPQHLNN